MWTVTWRPRAITGKAEMMSTTDLKELPSLLQDTIEKALVVEAPQLTVRNHRQLCGAGAASRTFCLVLVDMPDGPQLQKVLEDLAASRAEHAKELSELREAAEASEDGGD